VARLENFRLKVFRTVAEHLNVAELAEHLAGKLQSRSRNSVPGRRSGSPVSNAAVGPKYPVSAYAMCITSHHKGCLHLLELTGVWI
jgi:hypothetical protein